MEVSKFNHPFYNQGYFKALQDLESLVACIVSDCKRCKVPFTEKRVHEFFKLVLENHFTIREGNFGLKEDAFVRVKLPEKKFEFYRPLKAKEVLKALVEAL